MKSFLARGVLIGSSVGVLAALFGLVPMGSGIVLGGIAGMLAGYTVAKKNGSR